MDRTAAALSANASRGVADSKQKHKNSKRSKDAARRKIKKQQEADLAGIGSQFQLDRTQQLFNPANYPRRVKLDD
ncbi:hypothetical protein FHL15_007986 [Xylaria flabelliformis]|uniref:Uncharacterized protein n=1 Tax=Xylaria flabelliformis TaxID=2512241 RepID=A0A553HTB5_9PEZI|nr:hypothetical protein FHL15_007986 [Xylaria flabelliformis]